MDRATRTEIQRIAAATLQDAGLTDPPLSVEGLLDHVHLYRDYYDLSNPSFLDRAKHKLRITGRKLVDIVAKVRLQATAACSRWRASKSIARTYRIGPCHIWCILVQDGVKYRNGRH